MQLLAQSPSAHPQPGPQSPVPVSAAAVVGQLSRTRRVSFPVANGPRIRIGPVVADSSDVVFPATGRANWCAASVTFTCATATPRAAARPILFDAIGACVIKTRSSAEAGA